MLDNPTGPVLSYGLSRTTNQRKGYSMTVYEAIRECYPEMDPRAINLEGNSYLTEFDNVRETSYDDED